MKDPDQTALHRSDLGLLRLGGYRTFFEGTYFVLLNIPVNSCHVMAATSDFVRLLPDIEMKAYMQVLFNIPLILGTLRPSKQLTCTQSVCSSAPRHLAAHQFLQLDFARLTFFALILLCLT